MSKKERIRRIRNINENISDYEDLLQLDLERGDYESARQDRNRIAMLKKQKAGYKKGVEPDGHPTDMFYHEILSFDSSESCLLFV